MAATTLRAALRADGLDVIDVRVRPTFADLHITDPVAGQSTELQLGLDYRQFPPAQLSVGPVLDVRDAVAGKMSALWSRGEARDYINRRHARPRRRPHTLGRPLRSGLPTAGL